jgi:hypothetical protein
MSNKKLKMSKARPKDDTLNSALNSTAAWQVDSILFLSGQDSSSWSIEKNGIDLGAISQRVGGGKRLFSILTVGLIDSYASLT